jgi:hypothetical protein
MLAASNIVFLERFASKSLLLKHLFMYFLEVPSEHDAK